MCVYTTICVLQHFVEKKIEPVANPARLSMTKA